MEKPTLHEIAAMPFPASMLAMRKHYNPRWGKPIDGDGEMRTYKVKLDYSYTVNESDTFEVEALSEAEAEEQAIELLEKQCAEDFEVDDVDVKAVGDA